MRKEKEEVEEKVVHARGRIEELERLGDGWLGEANV